MYQIIITNILLNKTIIIYKNNLLLHDCHVLLVTEICNVGLLLSFSCRLLSVKDGISAA